jgi:hypothetical protein
MVFVPSDSAAVESADAALQPKAVLNRAEAVAIGHFVHQADELRHTADEVQDEQVAQAVAAEALKKAALKEKTLQGLAARVTSPQASAAASKPNLQHVVQAEPLALGHFVHEEKKLYYKAEEVDEQLPPVSGAADAVETTSGTQGIAVPPVSARRGRTPPVKLALDKTHASAGDDAASLSSDRSSRSARSARSKRSDAKGEAGPEERKPDGSLLYKRTVPVEITVSAEGLPMLENTQSCMSVFAVLWLYDKEHSRWQEHGRTEVVRSGTSPQFSRAFHLEHLEHNDSLRNEHYDSHIRVELYQHSRCAPARRHPLHAILSVLPCIA